MQFYALIEHNPETIVCPAILRSLGIKVVFANNSVHTVTENRDKN